MASPAGSRFSLLLLAEGEVHVREVRVTCSRLPAEATPGEDAPRNDGVPGSLRVCSHSLLFEPDDRSLPVCRLEYAACTSVDPRAAADGRGGTLALQCSSITRMREGGVDHPYRRRAARGGSEGGMEWEFAIDSALDDTALDVSRYLAASRLPPAERRDALARALRERQEGLDFDLARLEDFGEAVRVSLPATLVTPLVREPGRLVITDRRLYFQRLYNARGGQGPSSHPLGLVLGAAARVHGLSRDSMEVFFLDPAALGARGARAGPAWGSASATFALSSRADLREALAHLARSDAVGAGLPAPGWAPALRDLLLLRPRWVARAQVAWSRGLVSSFEYLLWLNLASGRSFNDLSQWPVMPWVLGDYVSETLGLRDGGDGGGGAEGGGDGPATPPGGGAALSRAGTGMPEGTFRDLSKPVGALNEGRLRSLRARMSAMQEAEALGGGAGAGPTAPYLYGTHYSTPGYVVFWLARAAPGHLLRLQGGAFDEADRLFRSVPAAWRSVVSPHLDLKELVPEFFLPDASFLHNRAGLDLGRTAAGDRVDDVELPRWAGGDSGTFLATNRLALESPGASRALHRWIDLVFGCQQRGEAAVAADNLFFPVTYFSGSRPPLDPLADGAADEPPEPAAVVAARYGVDAEALEQQVHEFGQCPAQLFVAPHPPRRWAPGPEAVPDAVGGEAGGGAEAAAELRRLAFLRRPVRPGGAGEPAGSSPAELEAVAERLLRAAVEGSSAPGAEPALEERHTAAASSAVQLTLVAVAAAAAGVEPDDPEVTALLDAERDARAARAADEARERAAASGPRGDRQPIQAGWVDADAEMARELSQSHVFAAPGAPEPAPGPSAAGVPAAIQGLHARAAVADRWVKSKGAQVGANVKESVSALGAKARGFLGGMGSWGRKGAGGFPGSANVTGGGGGGGPGTEAGRREALAAAAARRAEQGARRGAPHGGRGAPPAPGARGAAEDPVVRGWHS